MSVMKLSKILNYLNQAMVISNTPIVEADLTKPDKLSLIYTKLAEILTPEEPDYEEKYREIVESPFDQREIYEEPLKEIRTYRLLKKLMDGASVLDFTVNDLHYPEEKRTIAILSQILQFGLFRENKINSFSKFTGEIERLQTEYDIEIGHRYEIQCEIQNLKQQQQAEEPKIQQLLQINDDLVSQIEQLNKLQYELSEKASELKKKNKDLRIEIQNCNELIYCTVQDIQKLEEDLVDNPTVLLTLIDEKRNRVESLKASIDELEKSIQNTQLRIDLFTKTDKETDKSLDLLYSTADETSNCQKLKVEKQKLKLQFNEKKQKLTDIENSLRLSERKVLNTNDRIQRFSQKNQQKITSHRQNLALAKNEEKENLHFVADYQSQTLQNRTKLQNLKQKMENFEKSQADTTASLQQRFDSLLSNLHSYHSRLLHEMKQN